MKSILVLLAIVSLLGLAGPAAAQATFDLEHFRCYPVRKTDHAVSATVALRDQFGVADDVDVKRTVRFCNPTRKYHNGTIFDVQDARQHLTFYATYPQESPLRVAVIDNQFGQQVLLLREAVGLAVPTQKLKPEHDRPVGLDHFRCYQAVSTGPLQPTLVAMSDQFVPPWSVHYVMSPVSFCNPVEKRHDNVVTPIEHPEAHLTCYSTTRIRFSRETSILNQFSDRSGAAENLALGPPDRLCVPTRKLAWTEIPDLDPGTSAEELESLLGR